MPPKKPIRDVPPITGCSAGQILQQAERWLYDINVELFRLCGELATLNPQAPRSVTTFFNDHDKPCLGCPHLHWDQWAYRPKNAKHKWVPHRISNPLARLPRDGQSAQSRAVVNRISKLLQIRSEVIADLSHAARVIAGNRVPRATLTMDEAQAIYENAVGRPVSIVRNPSTELAFEPTDVPAQAAEQNCDNSPDPEQQPELQQASSTTKHVKRKVFQKDLFGQTADAGGSVEGVGGAPDAMRREPASGARAPSLHAADGDRRTPRETLADGCHRSASRNPNPSPAELLQRYLAQHKWRK